VDLETRKVCQRESFRQQSADVFEMRQHAFRIGVTLATVDLIAVETKTIIETLWLVRRLADEALAQGPECVEFSRMRLEIRDDCTARILGCHELLLWEKYGTSKKVKEVNMVKDCVRSFLLVILLAALPQAGWAQDARTVVGKAAKAMGAENLRTLQIAGSGSSYDEKGQHSPIKAYTRQIDLNATTSNAPWNTQVDVWITPYGFLKGAMANTATLESKTVYGEPYQVVTFTLPGNHKIVGYITEKDMVERVHAWVDNDILIEGVYRDYMDFGGVKVPTIMIQNRGGQLSQVVIVKEAKANR
jgi:hypothetical protein